MVKNYDEKLEYFILKPQFLIKKFIRGDEENCDYERYLLELVNNSNYFISKSKGKKFYSPDSESDGECDCISLEYEMDFKMIGGSGLMRAKNELSKSIHVALNGVTCYSGPRKSGKRKVAYINKLLRGLDYEKFKGYRNDKSRYSLNSDTSDEYEIQTYIKLLSKEKNLFLFFPFRFYIKGNDDFMYLINNIKFALIEDFKTSIKYRSEFYRKFETYISVICCDNLVIYKFEGSDKLIFIEAVPLNKSKVYMRLNKYV